MYITPAMPAETRRFFLTIAPIAFFSHWAGSLRLAMTADKDGCGSAEIEHVDHSRQEKGAVNTLLVMACVVFGAASFMFGYDDKVISPVAALTAFVSSYAPRPRWSSTT